MQENGVKDYFFAKDMLLIESLMHDTVEKWWVGIHWWMDRDSIRATHPRDGSVLKIDETQMMPKIEWWIEFSLR